jgi:hypothetical protein
MKKRVLFCLIFAIMLAIPFSYSDSAFNAERLKISFEIFGRSEIAGSGHIESATVNLSFFPKNFDGQKITKFSTEPGGVDKGKVIQFLYEAPQDDLTFRVSAEVETYNTIPRIKSKVDFPLADADEDLAVYTMPSKTIDSHDSDIVKLANEIVAGEDDLYSAVFKIGYWTKNNIKYDLSTLTADVSQKSSWVLENRQGVCDELTSLFIAMLRGLGIPARFVSGIAYTNSELFDEKWGPHGWAEVYFPGYGWIPYDVTYGEFGWIDPGHVKFKDSIDPDESSTNYQWYGSRADLEPQELDIKTELLEQVGVAESPIAIKVRFSEEAVKLGSYNLIIAEVENLNDFYYSTEISVVKPREIEIINGKSRGVILLPHEKKSFAWIARVDERLDDRFSYTFPVVIAASNNITSKADFAASRREKYVSFDDIEGEFEEINAQEEKEYSGNVLIDCKPSKNEFYTFENAQIECSMKNTGNVYISDAELCYEAQCNMTGLGISQEKNFIFKIDNSKIGIRDDKISFESSLLNRDLPVSFAINDAPKVEVTEIIHPINASYKGSFSLSFIIARKSSSVPKDVEITLLQNSNEKTWNLADLNENRKYVVDFLGKNLKYGKNGYRIEIEWKDDVGNKYSTSEEFSINLSDANPIQRAALIFNSFANLGAPYLIVVFVIVGVSFVVLVRWLFKKKGDDR